MWIALCVSAATYIPLSFAARGILRVSHEQWWKFEFHRQGDVQVQGQKRRSISMIACVDPHFNPRVHVDSPFLCSSVTPLYTSSLSYPSPSSVASVALGALQRPYLQQQPSRPNV